MERFALVLCLMASIVTAQTAKSTSEIQLATRATPVAATFGNPAVALPIGSADALRISVCGEAGSTLTGGTLKAWLYDPSVSAALRVQRLLEWDLTVGAPSSTCRVFPPIPATNKAGAQILFATSAMTATLSDAGTYTDGGYYVVGVNAWLGNGLSGGGGPPPTQPISGIVTQVVTGPATQTINGTVTATVAFDAGAVTAHQGGTWSAVGVTGTFWQATQPVSGKLMVVGPDGGDVTVRGADGGVELAVTGAGGNPVLIQASGGSWDSTATIGGTCTSTGTNATATVPASSYISGYCTAAAYVGIGNTCASADGGTIPTCMVRAANEAFYYRTGASSTTIACISVSGTTNCPLFTASN